MCALFTAKRRLRQLLIPGHPPPICQVLIRLPPTVVLNESNTYYLRASDSSCGGAGYVTLNIDTTYGVTAGPDVSFCNGVPVQLNGAAYVTFRKWNW